MKYSCEQLTLIQSRYLSSSDHDNVYASQILRTLANLLIYHSDFLLLRYN